MFSSINRDGRAWACDIECTHQTLSHISRCPLWIRRWGYIKRESLDTHLHTRNLALWCMTANRWCRLLSWSRCLYRICSFCVGLDGIGSVQLLLEHGCLWILRLAWYGHLGEDLNAFKKSLNRVAGLIVGSPLVGVLKDRVDKTVRERS